MKVKSVLLTVVLFLLLYSFSSAQDALKKGVYSLSGSISFSTSSNDMLGETTNSDYFWFNPSGGYFIMDNLLIGGTINYMYDVTKFESGGRTNTNYFRRVGIGPTIKYFFNGGTVFPFAAVSDSYFKSIDGGQEGNSLTVNAGLDYFLSRSVALEPSVSYSYSTYNMPDQKINQFSVVIGISYYIIP